MKHERKNSKTFRKGMYHALYLLKTVKIQKDSISLKAFCKADPAEKMFSLSGSGQEPQYLPSGYRGARGVGEGGTQD